MCADGEESTMDHEKLLGEALAGLGLAKPAERSSRDGAASFLSPPKERDGSDPRAALTWAQTWVVGDLAGGMNPIDAAARAGVHIERVRRWMKVPSFQRA